MAIAKCAWTNLNLEVLEEKSAYKENVQTGLEKQLTSLPVSLKSVGWSNVLNYSLHTLCILCNHIDMGQTQPGNITNKDLATLNGSNWLNDQVNNAY